MKKMINTISFLLSVVLLVTQLSPFVLAAGLDNFSRSRKYSEDTFSDVSAKDWFASGVKNAYEYGLMSGSSSDKFNPHGEITVRETVTIAAIIHSRYYGTTIPNEKGEWYEKYIKYAIDNGIISSTTNTNVKATRYMFAYILSKALPDEALKVKNDITSIPDVSSNEWFYSSILKLYKAGVITGSDEYGTFNPNTTIKRGSVATIVAKMVDENLRSTFIPKTSCLPNVSDYAYNKQWDGRTKPTHMNGPWADSFAVIDEITKEKANVKSKVERTFYVTNGEPKDSATEVIIEAWGSAVSLASDGKIKFVYSCDGTSFSEEEATDAVRKGKVDIAIVPTKYWNSDLFNVIACPSLELNNATAASATMWEVYNNTDLISQSPQGVKIIFVGAGSCTPIATSGKLVMNNSRAFTGWKNNPISYRICEKMGGWGVIGMKDYYEVLKYRVIDSLVCPWEILYRCNLYGVLNDYLDVNEGNTPFAIIMNEKTYNSLSKELKKAVDDASGTYLLNFVPIFDYYEALSKNKAIENGGEVYKPDSDTSMELTFINESVSNEWIQNSVSTSTAQLIFDAAKSLARKYNSTYNW